LAPPIVNGEKIAFENGGISSFEGLVTLTLDWVILHTIVHHSSLYIHTKFHWNWKNFFVDGQTYVHTDVHSRPTLL